MNELEKTYRAYNFHLFKNKRKNSVLPKKWREEVAALQVNESYPIDKDVVRKLNNFISSQTHMVKYFNVYCDAKQKIAFSCLNGHILVVHSYYGTENLVYNDNLLQVDLEDLPSREMLGVREILVKDAVVFNGFDLKRDIVETIFHEGRYVKVKGTEEVELEQLPRHYYELCGRGMLFDGAYIDMIIKHFGTQCSVRVPSEKQDRNNSLMELVFGRYTVVVCEIMA